MIIYNVNVVLSDTVINNGSIEVLDGIITKIFKSGRMNSGDIDGKGLNLFPGFIDIHTHGGYGFDFCDANSIPKICSKLVEEGITSVYPTTLSLPIERLKLILENLNKSYDYVGSKVQGVHLEGPFLSTEKKGAHNEDYLKDASHSYFDLINNNVKIVSYAIEKDRDLEFTKYLFNNDIVASIAHSNALCSDVLNSVNYGLKSVTHIFNGQSGVSHRNGGVAQAGLISDDLYVEVIADLIHLDRECLSLIYKCKQIDKIILITDSMQAKGLEEGIYKLGDYEVELKDDQVRLASGSLAGSVLKMPLALKNFRDVTNCSLAELSLVAATNAARLLNNNTIGEIEVGKIADLVFLDEEFKVKMTIINGKVAYDVL